jgi:hemoglobin
MDRSLYERLGGRDGIAAIVNDSIDLHLVNPALAPRFQNKDVGKLKKLGHEFFCAGAGGPEAYSGRVMREAHAGMNISEQEFLATIDDIVTAMQKRGVASSEQNEVVGILYSLKNDILRV